MFTYEEVTPEMRSTHYNATGMMDTDAAILAWYQARKKPSTPISTGLKTDFYNIDDCQDVDDLAEHWDLGFDGGNCLKALVGIAKGQRHSGTDAMRDANKLVHYANRIRNRIRKQQLKDNNEY